MLTLGKRATFQNKNTNGKFRYVRIWNRLLCPALRSNQSHFDGG